MRASIFTFIQCFSYAVKHDIYQPTEYSQQWLVLKSKKYVRVKF